MAQLGGPFYKKDDIYCQLGNEQATELSRCLRSTLDSIPNSMSVPAYQAVNRTIPADMAEKLEARVYSGHLVNNSQGLQDTAWDQLRLHLERRGDIESALSLEGFGIHIHLYKENPSFRNSNFFETQPSPAVHLGIVTYLGMSVGFLSSDSAQRIYEFFERLTELKFCDPDRD